jgi:hypothetical protein
MGTTRYTTETSTVAQEVRTVIDSLTALAAAERMTPSGLPARYDLSEIIARVLTAVAANIGGLEPMLSARPGSWQAHYIRQLVAGTAPGDELLTHRTAPVRLNLDLAGLFAETGQAAAFESEWSVAEFAVRDAVTPEEAEEACSFAATLEALYKSDQEAYRAAYEAAVRAELAQRGLPPEIPVEVVAVVGAVDGPDRWWDELADDLHMRAYERTAMVPVLVDPEALGYTERATRSLAAQGGAEAATVGKS